MACMMTARRRASAMRAFRSLRRFAILSARLFSVKLWRRRVRIELAASQGFAWVQQGHRIRRRANATVRVLRSVAIEFEACRSGCIGGFAGSGTAGEPEVFRSSWRRPMLRGDRLPFGEKKPVSGYAETGVVVKSSPASSFMMAKTQVLFEVATIALDPPSYLRHGYELLQHHRFRHCRQPISKRLLVAFGPFDDEPFFGSRPGEMTVSGGDAQAYGSKA